MSTNKLPRSTADLFYGGPIRRKLEHALMLIGAGRSCPSCGTRPGKNHKTGVDCTRNGPASLPWG